jgi:hypothetical protein
MKNALILIAGSAALTGSLASCAACGSLPQDAEPEGDAGRPGVTSDAGHRDAAGTDDAQPGVSDGGQNLPLPEPDAGQASIIIDVQPKDRLIEYPSTKTLQFQALGPSGPVNAVWTIDNPDIGSIDQSGLFTASGAAAGIATVVAKVGNARATTTLAVRLSIAENPGNVSPSDKAKLEGGGSKDASFKWLYPYDATVFPRGLEAPVMQFAATAPSAFYVHITSKSLEYKGYFAGSSPASVALPQATWEMITKNAWANEPVKVEVTALAGGAAIGPISQTWTIAPGTLRGTVYYNSYTSLLAVGGGTLKIKIGQQAQLLLGGCQVCHAVSANGSVMSVSQFDYHSGLTYDLKANMKSMASNSGAEFNFGALTPNGAKLMSCGAPLMLLSSVVGNWTPHTSKLFDTKTGALLSAPGFDGVIGYAITPMFSPNGNRLAFGHFDTGQGHTLEVMDFDDNTNTFSNLTTVHQDPTYFVSWPAYLPDGNTLVFQQGDRADYSTWLGAKSNIKAVDLATKTAVALDALNGISNGSTYLPYGEAETNMNYEPTVLPVAVGGYYWVLFTSRRNYGNTIASPLPVDQIRKKLWVAAIDMKSTPGKDPSHPAFYLPGQELAAGNMRGFWVLDPCKENGNGCEGGDECCSGFCRAGEDGGFRCVDPPNACSEEFEKCTTDADCCAPRFYYEPKMTCINSRCAKVAGPN